MIIVFGSVANGTYTETSDLDLLVVMQTDLRPHQRAVAVRESVSDIDLAMDIHVYDELLGRVLVLVKYDLLRVCDQNQPHGVSVSQNWPVSCP